MIRNTRRTSGISVEESVLIVVVGILAGLVVWLAR